MMISIEILICNLLHSYCNIDLTSLHMEISQNWGNNFLLLIIKIQCTVEFTPVFFKVNTELMNKCKKKKRGGGRNNILRFNPPVQKKGRIRNFKMETL